MEVAMYEDTYPKILPIGIESFEKMITGNYYYADKTLFIKELLDNKSKVITFLRPRRFGKSLFVSTLEAYYDTRFENQFEKLFGDRTIGRNPTRKRNAYSVLKLNFSGILSDSTDLLRSDMYDSVASQLQVFIDTHELQGTVCLELEQDSEKRFRRRCCERFSHRYNRQSGITPSTC